MSDAATKEKSPRMPVSVNSVHSLQGGISTPHHAPVCAASGLVTPQKPFGTMVKCTELLVNGLPHWTPAGPCSDSPVLNLQQASPCIRTPGSDCAHSRSTPHLHTPKNNITRLSPQMSTPNQPIYNPFDGMQLDKLGGNVFSPNVFARITSAEHTPKTFQWTVDELAILKPVDIDEMPHQQDAAAVGRQDPDMEERAQQVIDHYFASNMIAPSPWTDSAKKRPYQLPQTPRTPASFSCSPMKFGQTGVQGKRDSLGKREVSCQTMLTLPPNYDLQKLLGGEFQYHEADGAQEENGTDLSTSTMRRKLFFHGEAGTPPSPVKPYKAGKQPRADLMEYDGSPPVSPVKCQTPKQVKMPGSLGTPVAGFLGTPGSAQFSSSPISGMSGNSRHVTPSLRRCSTAPDTVDSPGFSPIFNSRGTGSRGSHSLTPLCQPLQATPSSGRPDLGFGSPGMSPIVLANGSGGSYMLTPQSLSAPSRRRGQNLPIVPIPLELAAGDSPGFGLRERRDSLSPALGDDSVLSGHQMETGLEVRAGAGAGARAAACHDDDAGILFSARGALFREYAGRPGSPDSDSASSEGLSDRDYTQQDTLQTHLLSQDTGYQTNSLQSTTNQDAGVTSSDCVTCYGESSASMLHTNLTQQFNSLAALGADAEDAAGSDVTHQTSSSGMTFKGKITRHISKGSRRPGSKVITRSRYFQDSALEASRTGTPDPEVDVAMDTPAMSDSAIVRRARRALGKSISDESQCHSDSVGMVGVDWPEHPGYVDGQKRRPPAAVLASQVATQALSRAREDYARYYIPEAHTEAGSMYFTSAEDAPDHRDPLHQCANVSMSAEF